MKKTETIHITGLGRFREELEQIAQHNPDFDLSRTELSDAGRVGERIYENLYLPGQVQIIPVSGENHSAAQEAENPETVLTAQEAERPRELRVLADGVPVGNIIRKSVPKVSQWLEKNVILSLRLQLQGGPYKILFPEEDGEVRTEYDQAGMFGLLTVEYEDGTKEEVSSFEEDASLSYISTTYATTQLTPSTGKRGGASLVLAILISGFYLGFSAPYWILSRMGRLTPLPVLGGEIKDTLLYPHLGIMAGGFLLAVIALLTKNWVWPLLSALAFTASCYFLPGYALAALLPAFFAGIASLRRKSKNGLFTFLKVLLFLGSLGCLRYFLKPTAENLFRYHRLIITPTNEPVSEDADFRPEEQNGGEDPGANLGEDDFGDFGDLGDFDEDNGENFFDGIG